MYRFSVFILAGALCLPNCTTPTPASLTEDQLEAREDSLELVETYARQEKIVPFVTATAETDAVRAGTGDDAADDPAVWINPTDVSQSIIFGSNKKGGIVAYTFDGKQTAYYPVGRVNNLDVLPMGTDGASILGASNRSSQTVDFFFVNDDGTIEEEQVIQIEIDSTKIDDVYGFTFAQHNGKNYAIVNGKNGFFQQYELDIQDSSINATLVREIAFSDITEGMVADTQSEALYVGEENVGIWKLSISPSNQDRRLLPEGTIKNNEFLHDDIEGLTLYDAPDGSGYLIASSQGNFSYAVFDRASLDYLGSFRIADGPYTDGAEETDGIHAVADSINPTFPRGLLIVQDGFNYDDSVAVAQNFKLVDWREIQKIIDAFE